MTLKIKKGMKILDCTLRDGGYYTEWDFSKEIVRLYIESLNQLPVDYIEIGYRSKPMVDYYGEFFYCPVYIMEQIRQQCSKKIAIMLNEKDVSETTAPELLKPTFGLIDMVRLAVDPKNFRRALKLAELINGMGFEVGFNVMYMSKWPSQKDFLNQLNEVDEKVEYFNMVDSYGGVYPNDVREIYNLVRSKTNVKIGFHGHNSLELGLINTLTAIDCGAEIVDTTITGMGRGAGNLKTELLLIALNAKRLLEFDFNMLSKVVDSFSNLQKEYQWGSNLPYMFSGANSLPQKEVMEWVGKRFYSFNSILRALTNQTKGIKDNQQFPSFELTTGKRTLKALIVGGGSSVVNHADAIIHFLNQHPDMVIIHASSKNSMVFQDVSNRQIFCLVGNEGHRMEDVFSGDVPQHTTCILPPYPRKMGTYIPKKLRKNSYELANVNFTDKYIDSHTAIALQATINLAASSIEIIGYDGYSNTLAGQKEQELFIENEYLFKKYLESFGTEIRSLTPTVYEQLEIDSIYSKI